MVKFTVDSLLIPELGYHVWDFWQVFTDRPWFNKNRCQMAPVFINFGCNNHEFKQQSVGYVSLRGHVCWENTIIGN